MTSTVPASPLNPEQRQVALLTDRHLILDAGAGSGKTTLLIEKLMFEMGFGRIEGETPPEHLRLDQIGAITFTRKAAGEIRERLRRAFVERAEASEGEEREKWAIRAFLVDDALIETIDAFAARVIREYGALAGVEAGFDVLDEADAAVLYSEVAESAILDGVGRDDPGALFLVRHYGYLRTRGLLEDLLRDPALLLECERRLAAGQLEWGRVLGDGATEVDRLLEPHARACLTFALDARRRLAERLEAEGALDFSHVLLRAADLAAHPVVQAAFRERIRLLFVDEHQDTSLTQVRLLFQLAGIEEGAPRPPATRLVLIGDPKQGIYGFRGADITMWRKSAGRLVRCGGQYNVLRRNHRSTPGLLRFFDDAFVRLMGPPKDPDRPDYEVGYVPLEAVREGRSGASVEVILASEPGRACDAVQVAERIQEMLERAAENPVWDKKAKAWVPLERRHIAVLSARLRGVASTYEEALRERGIESYILGGTSLYRRDEIKDLANLLSAVSDPHDPFTLASFLRSPLGGVDDATLMHLARVSTAAARGERQGSLYEALSRADELVPEIVGRDRCRRAYELLERLRGMRDRSPHAHLLEEAIRETGFRAFLAGAPDAPAGLRNLDKLLGIARRSGEEPLSEFVRRMMLRVKRADAEEEAPLYSPDDDLVTISTIHKAKGLEWPIVFVVGLDQPVVMEVRDDAPRLHESLGLVMNLDVVLRDGGTEARVQEHSGAWRRAQEEETRKRYAEAKRLFYVACTRAQDRLFLCGALNRPQGRGIFSAPSWMHRDGVERWLRHLYPPLTRSGRSGEAFAYGEAWEDERGNSVQDTAPIRRAGPSRPLVQIGGARRWVGEIGLGLHGAPGRENAPRALPPEVRSGLASLDDRAVIRDEFSASELLKFATCSWMHFFGYRGAISAPAIEGDIGRVLVNEILPRQRGDILHDYLRRHDDRWGEDRKLDEMRAVLLRHLQMPDDAAWANARELMLHANDYLRSPWYERLKTRALQVRREVPFVFQLAPGIRFRGVLDLLWRERDGWRILDFKTGTFRAQGATLDRQVAERVEEYRIQAAIYSLGALAALGADQVREFVFFFTHPAQARTLEVGAAWPRNQVGTIETLVRKIRAGEYGLHPLFDERLCTHCDYLRVCRPRNAPPQVFLGKGIPLVAEFPETGADLPSR